MEKSSSCSSALRSTRLIFDRRYGWICDEWKEPSKEALAGGRGMFCIFPIAKGVLDLATRSLGDAACVTKNVLEKPEILSPDSLLESVWQSVSEVWFSPSLGTSIQGRRMKSRKVVREHYVRDDMYCGCGSPTFPVCDSASARLSHDASTMITPMFSSIRYRWGRFKHIVVFSDSTLLKRT